VTAWLLVVLGAGLTIGTALFVAAEFSFVALDPSQIEGDAKGARRVRRALRSLSTQLSGAQVGITLTTVLLGFTAQPALAEILEGPFEATPWVRAASATVAAVVALIVVNVFSMIVGELVPKNAAIARPLATATAVAPFMLAFTLVLRPLIATLNGAANAVVRALGMEPREELAGGRSRQELAALVRRSAQAGTLAPSTALLLTNTLDLDDLAADDVMTDRTRLHTVALTATAADVLALARGTGHSRFPVVRDGVDDVAGLVHVRQALAVPAHERDSTVVSDLMVDAPRVPETMALRPLLGELKDLGLQCALVIDEYGGTAGFVTLEDVVEELVGDVADEHDSRRSQVFRAAGGAWVLPAVLRPDEVGELTGIDLPSSHVYETVGGLVMAALGRLPGVGDLVDVGNVRITVERMDGRRIDRVRALVMSGTEQP
jgi:CBS domain containing-hemolysin-like protein